MLRRPQVVQERGHRLAGVGGLQPKVLGVAGGGNRLVGLVSLRVLLDIVGQDLAQHGGEPKPVSDCRLSNTKRRTAGITATPATASRTAFTTRMLSS